MSKVLTTIGVATFVSFFIDPVRSSGNASVKIDGSSTVYPIIEAEHWGIITQTSKILK